MVGLCVDVLWMVVWLSVRAVGTVCEVEGDVQVVSNFHVCLYSYVKSMSLEASCDVFPYSFSLWSGCVFENGESVVSIQPDEWATTKQACRDELVVYLFFFSHI